MPAASLCAIYTRQSRTRYGQLSSCEAQRAICTEMVHEFDWNLSAESFDDSGEPSESLDRPGLQRLITAIESGQVCRVIVYSIDRLTRKLSDLHQLSSLFERYNVLVSVVTDPRFGETAAARLMTNIVAAASEFQQDITRERMADVRAALKRKGRRVAGRVPFGFTTDPTTKQSIVQSSAAVTVHQMFQFAITGKYPREIADAANAAGWKNQNGVAGRWTARQILKILSNPAYARSIRNGQGMLPGNHSAIVSNTVFEQVRSLIRNRRSRIPGRAKPAIEWPLRGILKCGQCQRLMTGRLSGYKNRYYRYYRCGSHAGGRAPCQSVSIPAFEIEEYVRLQISAECHRQGQQLAMQWVSLDEFQQTKSLKHILEEVVYHSNEGTISFTVFADAASRLIVPLNSIS